MKAAMTIHESRIMKDVKVDVRVNVSVDAGSVVLLLASAAAALFVYKQQKHQQHQDKLTTPGA
jgi:predicted TIM-barrel enzyme